MVCSRNVHTISGRGCRGGSRCPAFSRTRKNGVRAERLPDSSKGLPCAGWCHPLRRSGIMVTRRLFGFRSEGQGELVRAEGLEPSRALRPNGFSYPSTAFAAPAVLPQGLGSGLSLHRVPDVFPVVRCCPSSLYTFPTGVLRQGLARDRHVTGFPEFEQFCIAGFPASTQVCA
jgi:hypothetical protein